jgi:hypothetical protein
MRKGIGPELPSHQLDDKLGGAPMIPKPSIDEGRLVDLLHDPATTRQDWQPMSLCRGTNDDYFPDDGAGPPDEALLRCRACPVAHECLATALSHEAADGYRFGWWGGFGPDDRTALWEQLAIGFAARTGERSAPVNVDVGPTHPVAQARQLRAQQLTIAAIAAQLGCSERTVHRYLAAIAA